jgi:hypothetical protein
VKLVIVAERRARALALEHAGALVLVNELHKALVPARGLIASGKFEQYKRDIPYATLAQAFRSLVLGPFWARARPNLSDGGSP